MDIMVLKSQQWMNDTYGGDSRYTRVAEDGATGWGTINGLIIALQIELGMAETAAVIGPTTRGKFNAKYPGGITRQAADDTDTDNVHSIIQCALWCKGYYAETGSITGYYKGQSADSVEELKADMGIGGNSTVTMEIMEALLSMKQFVLLSGYGGTEAIRGIQQTINKDYKNYTGIIPCDGLYGREMNTAIIQVLQAVEGFAPEVSNGNFGNGTKGALKVINATNAAANPDWVWIASVALICNGYLDNTERKWVPALQLAIETFQVAHALPITRQLDVNTWMSLFISKGNPDRAALGCDCATVLNADKATALYNEGYRYVGRYLTGYVGSGSTARPKAMTKEELSAVFSAGLRVFAIYQDNNPVVSYYTYEQGLEDGVKAFNAAKNLGVPEGEFIYFAVDCDMMDYQVTANAIPYFRGIREALKGKPLYYKVGIYGSRNTCTRVSDEGLAKSSFVGDMSTGYSGNMGYRIPTNWAFDQFHEYVFTGASVNFDLDKDAYSGRYSGFNHVENYDEAYISSKKTEAYIDRAEQIFDELGYGVPIEMVLEKETLLMKIPNLEANYKVSISEALNLPEEDFVQIIVSNGKFDEAQMEIVSSEFESLDAETREAIGGNGAFKTISTLASEIGNGKVVFSYEISSDGKLVFRYGIEEEVFNDQPETEKLCVYVSITITNDTIFKEEFESIMESLPSLETVAMVTLLIILILLIIFTGISLAAILKALAAFLTAYAV